MVDDDAAVVAGSDRWLEGEGEEPLARCAPMALGRLRSSRGVIARATRMQPVVARKRSGRLTFKLQV